MLAEHLDQRVLGELPGRSGCEERRTFRLPRVPDPVTASDRLLVAPFGVSGKIGCHEKPGPKLSAGEMAWCDAAPLFVLDNPPPPGSANVPTCLSESVGSALASRLL